MKAKRSAQCLLPNSPQETVGMVVTIGYNCKVKLLSKIHDTHKQENKILPSQDLLHFPAVSSRWPEMLFSSLTESGLIPSQVWLVLRRSEPRPRPCLFRYVPDCLMVPPWSGLLPASVIGLTPTSTLAIIFVTSSWTPSSPDQLYHPSATSQKSPTSHFLRDPSSNSSSKVPVS